MSTRLFHDAQQWELDDGLPNNGGKITFWEPGTTTLKSVYTTSSLTTAHTNPVILDANGRPTNPIWLSGEYKYAVTTSGDVAVGLTIDNLNADTAAAVTESGLLVANGSFEVDTGDDGTPDSWTLSALTSATIAVDTTDSAHGVNSLLFTSGGNGGGTATSTRFDVRKSKKLTVSFTYKASSATVKTIVDVKTYDKDNVIISTLNAHSLTTGNPTSYTTYHKAVTIDATAVTAEIVFTGIDAASTTKTAGTTTNVDNIYVPTDDLLDEDDMVSDSDAIGATQQSIKAYVDNKIVILNTPVILATDTTTTATSNTPVDITAQTTGVATKAILNVFVDVDGASAGADTSEVLVGEGGETLTTLVHRAVYAAYGDFVSDSNQVTINLATGEIFDYAILQTGTAPTSRTLKIYLAGYYI